MDICNDDRPIKVNDPSDSKSIVGTKRDLLLFTEQYAGVGKESNDPVNQFISVKR